MERQNAYWYVAKTRHGAELGVRDRLSALGVENFVPTRTRKSSRGKGTVEVPAMMNFVFIHTTRANALDLIHFQGVKADYLFDCATRQLMTVPDKQMEDFRRVFNASLEEGGLVDAPLQLGEWVRVVKGSLRGVEGTVMEFQGRFYVVVSLMNCLYARARVPRAWLEKIEK
jgi:hypothetical protein